MDIDKALAARQEANNMFSDYWSGLDKYGLPNDTVVKLRKDLVPIADKLGEIDAFLKPTVPPVDPEPTTGKLPSEIFGGKWTEMAPFNKAGATNSPENLALTKAELDPRYKELQVPYKTGYKMRVYPAKASHSSGSKYGRLELRETNKAGSTDSADLAAWDSSQGSHKLSYSFEIVQSTLTARPRTIVGQIHGSSDDLVKGVWDNGKFGFTIGDDEFMLIDLPVGTRADAFIQVVDGKLTTSVTVNGVTKTKEVASFKKTGCYFKVGNYANTGGASEYKEPESAFIDVGLLSATVTHA